MAGEIQHLTRRPADGDPLEGQSLAPLILCLSFILIALAAWATWDESETRRPWKDYQRRYRTEASALIAARIDSAGKHLEEIRQSPAGRLLAERLAEAEARHAPETLLGRKAAALEQEIARLQALVEELRGMIQAASGENLRLEARGRPFSDPARAALRAELRKLDRRLFELETEREERRTELAHLLAPLVEARTAWEEPARALADLERLAVGLASERPRVAQVLLPATGEVERCTSCHTAMAGGSPDLGRNPWNRHPGDYLVHHPVERFGCVCCHGGNGTALDGLAGAHGFEISLPRELRRGSTAQGACVACHLVEGGRDRALFGGELKGAPELALALKSFERNLCHGCHETPGFPGKVPLAVPLDQVSWKLRPERVARIIRDPAAERPDARMPRFYLTEEQIDHLANYVLSLPGARPAPLEWPEQAFKSEEEMSEEELDALDEILDRGARLWARVQCASCHRRGDKGGNIDVNAPDLSRIGPELGREWLFRHLEAPASLFPEGQMPTVEWRESDIRDMLEYILRDPEFGEEARAPWRAPAPLPRPDPTGPGATLVRDLGCAGCHAIPGHERDPLTGNSLIDYGQKKPADFDFAGRTDLPETVEAWTRVKLLDPRAFGEALEMPVPLLTEREAAAVTSLLLGFTGRALPQDWLVSRPSGPQPAGEVGRLFAQRRCLTCHSLGGRGGDYAPDLAHQGSRTGREWLKRFLAEPFSIRPRLVQMPQFYLGQAEVELICDFFEMACRRDEWEIAPNETEAPAGSSPRLDSDASERALSSMEQHACRACHIWQGKGGVIGADIQDIGNRLRLGFLRNWLRDPAFLDKDTLAPRHGLSGPEADLLAEYLHATGRRQ